MLKVAAIIFAVSTFLMPEAYSSDLLVKTESIEKANGHRRRALRNRNRSHNRDYRRERNRSHNRNYRRHINRERNRSYNRGHVPRYNHTPHRYNRTHHRNWYNPRSFWTRVPRNHVYRDRWLRWNYNYRNGFHWYNNYPWFVFNNYLHRYSDSDNCNYELVDGYYDEVVERFYSMSCRRGYDECARLRDDWNWEEREDRYFCSETRYDY
jgi:hypothetical protein